MGDWLKYVLINEKIVQKDNVYPIVWDDSLISIYQFLLPYSNAKKLPNTAKKLPDESSEQIRWAAGAMDGVMTHHSTVELEKQRIDTILTLLEKVSVKAHHADVKQLYSLIKNDNTLELIDTLIARFTKSSIKFEPLYSFIHWLALNSPDREVVKFAITMLGSYSIKQTELFQLLGMHDEFTLYSSIALQHTFADNQQELERQLFALAKKVNGWGRIHLVEQLAKNPSPEVKNWLLREGYKNSVMNEYLAYTCATAGDLQTALAQPSVDMELLIAAGEMIDALILGGPAKDMSHYDEGAVVCLSYLTQLQKQAINDLNILSNLLLIRDFFVENVDDSYPNWDEKIKTTVIDTVNKLIAQDQWLPLVKKNMQSADRKKFAYAINLYSRLGFDAWPLYFEHQKCNDSSQWYYLMQTDDSQRVQKTIQLAKQQYDLLSIATGPELTSCRFTKTIKEHYVLGFILSDLDRFPGVGEDLILVGLNSPVTDSRNEALQVIERWGQQFWSADLKNELKKLANIEPDKKTKQRVFALLNILNL